MNYLLKHMTGHMTDLDQTAVLSWEGRSKRQRKPPPKTYWEEYVATDEWYLRELVSDVPAEEWDAALVDEEWSADEGEEEESERDEEEEDESYSDEDDNSSDGEDSSDEGSRDSGASDVDSVASDADSVTSTRRRRAVPSVPRDNHTPRTDETKERESGGEGADETRPGGASPARFI